MFIIELVPTLIAFQNLRLLYSLVCGIIVDFNLPNFYVYVSIRHTQRGLT